LAYHKLGNLRKALRDYNKWIELEPKSGLAYLKRGSLLFEMGHYRQALADFAKVKKLDPQKSKKPDFKKWESEALQKVEEGYHSPELSDEESEDLPGEIEITNAVAAALGSRHETIEKIRSLLIQVDQLFFERKNLRKTIDSYGAIIMQIQSILVQQTENEPTIPFLNEWLFHCHCTKAVAHADLNEHDQAIQEAILALALRPDDCKVHALIAKSYYYKGLFDQAIHHGTIALKSPISDIEFKAHIYIDRAIAHQSKGQFREAFQDFQQSIAHNPNSPYVATRYFGVGQMLLHLKRYEAAVAYFSRGLARMPNDRMALTFRAQAYDAIGKPDLAEADRKKAQELTSTPA
jgi:tetratricopeptide (TPR) repeat protein